MQVVIRSLAVLRLLGRSSRGLTLAEISHVSGIPPATTHRILAVLESERFVVRSPTNKRYFLGPAALELHSPVTPRQSPLVTAHPAVAEAADQSGETVFISELVGGRVVCLALCESVHPLRLFVRVGQMMPLHAAASARVLLAWLSPPEVRQLMGSRSLSPFTSETPRSIDAVLDRLGKIRFKGYDCCESELDEEVWAVAAPVRSSTTAVVASITMAVPQARANSEVDRDRYIAIVLAAARRMSADLGSYE